MSAFDTLLSGLRSRFWDLELIPYVAPTAYTPTMVGGTTAGTTTYSVQVGSYVRMGKIIHAQGRVSWTAATGTGVTRIGLPFTSSATTNLFSAASIATDSVTFGAAAPPATGGPMGLVFPNTAYFELKYPVSNDATVDIAVEAAGTVFFQVTYIID